MNHDANHQCQPASTWQSSTIHARPGIEVSARAAVQEPSQLCALGDQRKLVMGDFGDTEKGRLSPRQMPDLRIMLERLERGRRKPGGSPRGLA